MSVPAGIGRTRYIGANSTGPFAFNFVVYSAADLKVVKRLTTGVNVTLVLNTDYAVTLADDFSSATLVLVSPLAGDGIDDGDSEILTVTRDPLIQQLTQWPRNDPFPSQTHERAADYAVMMIGRLNEKVGRAPLLSETSALSNLLLPDPVANTFLGWNAGANALENKSVVDASAIVLPVSSTDNALVRWDGATGAALQNSGVIVDDNGDMSGVRNSAQTGYFDLAEIASPTNPAANVLRLHSRDIAGTTHLFAKDSGGRNRMLTSDVFNVIEYGATGDGTTNDTAAIQAAIDAAEVNGGVVFFPRGSYKVTKITVAAANVELVGEGAQLSQILAINNNNNIVEFDGTSGFFIYGGISDLSITGGGSSSSAGTALTMTNVGAIFAERLLIQNVYNGLLMQDAIACRAIGVDIANFVNNAFIHAGTGNNPYFLNCTTFQNAPYAPGGASFHMSDSEGFWIDNCVSSLATNGLVCGPGNGQQCINGFVTNCDFDASADDAILILTSGSGEVANLKFVNCRATFSGGKGISINGGANCDGIMITNCELSKNVEEGLWINDGRHITVSNCLVLGNAATGTPSINGINILGGDGILISNVHSGAYPDAGGNNQVYGLKVQSSFTGGLLVDNCDMRGNTAGAVSNDATGSNIRIKNVLGHALDWALKSKQNFTSRSSTTTLANDPDLQFEMAANTNYMIRMRVFFSTVAAGDFKFALVGPASPNSVSVVRKHIDPSALTTLVTASEGVYTASTAIAGGAGTAGGYIEFDIRVRNGTNAGTFAFQWAQNASDAGATVVLEGSYLEYRQA